MKLLRYFLASLAFALSAVGTEAADSYLRIGLFVEQRQADGTIHPGDCLSFAPTISPGKEKFLRLYSDSNAPTILLVLAVDRNTRDVSKEWAPKLWVQNEKFAEIVYPSSEQAGIPYRADTSLDLFIVSIPPTFKGLDKLKKNLAQIESLKDKPNEQAYLLRVGLVRQQVEQWFQDQNKATSVAQYRPPAKAATQRSGATTTILWREKHLVHKFVTGDGTKPFVARIPVIPTTAKPPATTGDSAVPNPTANANTE